MTLTDQSSSPSRQLIQEAIAQLRSTSTQLRRLEYEKTEPIAIIGIGCRFPGGANNPQEFWQLLKDGKDCIGPIPHDRWDVNYYFDPNQDMPGKMYTRFGGFINDIDNFDPQFFNISPREAKYIDPQHRLLLEVSWEALENANLPIVSLQGSQTGIFVGMSNDDYARISVSNNTIEQIDNYTGIGIARSVAAGRIAYLLGLNGPVLQVDTACSSSLLAVHLACQSLRSKECDLALAGGVNLILSPDTFVGLSKLKALSPDGKCKVFDKGADGYGRGEGCGVVVLKRISDLTESDEVIALIRGSAVNHDGQSNGLTAPNGIAQEAVIKKAIEATNITPVQVNYAETHGTGTLLGDPVEVLALSNVLCKHRNLNTPLLMGSVKANIGHLEAASGIASLIKVALALYYKEIPPQINIREKNPYIPWSEISLKIPTELTQLPMNDVSLFASVSSFGLSGTNVHMVLENPNYEQNRFDLQEKVSENTKKREDYLFTLSAKTRLGLLNLAKKYFDYIKTETPTIGSVCYVANTGRSHFAYRHSFVAKSVPHLQQQLSSFIEKNNEDNKFLENYHNASTNKIAFLFTGQGSQYIGMGVQLYKTEHYFRKKLDECNEILYPYLGRSLLSIIDPKPGDEDLINQTLFAQPMLFSLEYALAELWKYWGIQPQVVMGHSLGEYAAACIAGAFSVEEGLRFVYNRARILQGLPNTGSMIAVFADNEYVEKIINSHAPSVSIAAINSPINTVISGGKQEVDILIEFFRKHQIHILELNISHAFHSASLDPILESLSSEADNIEFKPIAIPLYSNLYGKILEKGYVFDKSYWSNHARNSVKFWQGVNFLLEQECNIFLEIGPKPTLISFVKKAISNPRTFLLSSLNTAGQDWTIVLKSLAVLYKSGVEINWLAFEKGMNDSRNKLKLPTYPFERKKYWIENKGVSMKNNQNNKFNDITKQRLDTISSNLYILAKELLGESPIPIDIHTPFLEMGADSFSLAQAIQKIEQVYGVKITFQQIFDDLDTIYKLSDYINKQIYAQEPTIDSSLISNSASLGILEEKTLANSKSTSVYDKIVSEVVEIVSSLLEMAASEVDIHAPFVELGADSLILLKAISQIQNKYGVEITVRRLFEDLNTLDNVAKYIMQNITLQNNHERLLQNIDNQKMDDKKQELLFLAESSSQDTPTKHDVPNKTRENLEKNEDLLKYQLDVVSAIVMRQLEYLGKESTVNSAKVEKENEGGNSKLSMPSGLKEKGETTQENETKPVVTKPTISSWQFSTTDKANLSPSQQKYLRNFIVSYTQQTAKSKIDAQNYRPVWADIRSTMGFRPETKEICYPIVSDRSSGSRIWDIDGNEYIDLSMGFGVNLFGHNPQFVIDAIEKQLKTGIQLGPQSNLAGDVSYLIAKLTGSERVTFCNSGTEAVMTAMRIARASNGRSKIVIFSGSYHGHFDGTLAIPDHVDGRSISSPMVPGVLQDMVNDVVVLPYGSLSSLQIIQKQANELAAILVEPVQSRKPNLQPRDFLLKLRQIATDNNIALIFDEVLTGFRILPGGAQAWFGIKADIVTYGKIIGGGMPIGVVAGKAKYIDAVDGGFWTYGDDSHPMTTTTFVAGTFCKHPLAMAASHAVLSRMIEKGESLQKQLNARTMSLSERLNTLFAEKNVPIRVDYFGSVFRFVMSGNSSYLYQSLDMDLFFYHLIINGVYTWEGRTCFLSTAHTDEDLEIVYQAVAKTINELKTGEFLVFGETSDRGSYSLSTKEQNVKKRTNFPQTTPTPEQANFDKKANEIFKEAKPKEIEINEYLHNRFLSLYAEYDINSYEQSIDAINVLSIKYVIQAFRDLGKPLIIGDSFTTQELLGQLEISVPHKQELMGYLLSILERNGILSYDIELWRVDKLPFMENIDFEYQNLSNKYPQSRNELLLVERCGKNLSKIFSDEQHPLALLMPNGELNVLSKIYKDSPGALVMNTLIVDGLSTWVLPTISDRKIRLLEIGAGTGGTTSHILPILPQRDIEYVFSDVSTLFLSEAKKMFGDYKYVDYRLFDLEALPSTQDFERNAYDVIVISNALHAVSELDKALKYIYDLLTPDGFLILLETTERQNWLDITFGLTDGWRKYSDHELRSNHPLLSYSQWQKLLNKNQFSTIVSVPTNIDGKAATQSLFISRKKDLFPLMEVQKQLWFLAQLGADGSRAYNICVSIFLEGTLNLDKLSQALQIVVKRHDALRTTIHQGGNFQQVLPNLEIELSFIDFCNVDIHKRDFEVENWFGEESQREFDLVNGPLFRVSLLKLEDQKYRLVLTVHHIISDGWSIGLIFDEIGTCYSALIQNTDVTLAPPLQFREYIQWDYENSNSKKVLAHRDYWISRFSDTIPSLNLPTDYPRPSIKTFRAGRESIRFDHEFNMQITSASKTFKSTRFILLLGVYTALLHRLSGQKDIIVDIASARRTMKGSEKMIGFCANQLPVRSNIGDSGTFSDYLENIRGIVLDAFEHHDYPYAKLINELSIQRDASKLSPLTQTLFNFNPKSSMPRFGEMRISDLQEHISFVPQELGLHITEIGDELILDCIFNKDLFDNETIARMLKQYKNILGTVIGNPDIPFYELPLLEDDDKQKILKEWNRTVTAYPENKCIHEIFEAQVKEHPGAIALIFENHSITYKDLNQRANQLAHHLILLGIGPDSLVGIHVDRSIDMMVGLLGILKSGGAYIPLDPEYPEDRISNILVDSKASIIVTQEKFTIKLQNLGAEIICLDRDQGILEKQPTRNPRNSVTSENLAYVIYTSGSTGKPKGVMVEHKQVSNFFVGMDSSIGRPTNATWLAVTTISFDISVLELFWTLTRGCKVVIQGGVDTFLSSEKTLYNNNEIDFSLFYFASEGGGDSLDKYKLLIDGARFADENGFKAVWTPERHFNQFGGLFPNPAVTGAAIAAITKNVEIRAGSIVLPLHDPVLVAEDWSVVDNLSNGRVSLAFASGWHPNDFIIAPENYKDRNNLMIEGIKTIQSLWQGNKSHRRDGVGEDVEFSIYPHPVQRELPYWITAAGNPETFRLAGKLGANVLTHMLEQGIDELAEKIAAYREAWLKEGHNPRGGRVAVMLHTFVGASIDEVRNFARIPLGNYLKSTKGLLKGFAAHLGKDIKLDTIPDNELDELVDIAVDRYFENRGLFGTPESCMPLIEKLKDIGVDEVACLVDFGISSNIVMDKMKYLSELKSMTNSIQHVDELPNDYSIPAQIERHGVDHMQCTPSLARILIENPKGVGALKLLKKLLIGGEAFPKKLAEQLANTISGEIHNMYGPTETTIWSTTWRLARLSKSIYIGRPIANTKTYILDSHGQPLPIGIPGHLYIGGAGVTRGYFNQPDLTAERFIKNPFEEEPNDRLYNTGDLAKYLPDGNIEFLGRDDYQVKVNGFRIELGEVEYAIAQNTDVQDAVVMAIDDGQQKKHLVAFCVSKINKPLPEQSSIRTKMKSLLPDYMVPAYFVMLDEFPKTPNGKTDKNELIKLFSFKKKWNSQKFVAPRTKTEELLAEVWAKVLGIDTIGIFDDFFDLGGNSIQALQIIQLASQKGVSIHLSQLLHKHTIADLATVAVDNINMEIKKTFSGRIPLTPIQRWFFEQNRSNPSDYSQAILFESDPNVNTDLVRSVLQHIIKYHDMLRVKFRKNNNDWEQIISSEINEPVPFTVFDLSTVNPDQHFGIIQSNTHKLQASLNLEKGIVIQVAWFNLGSEKNGRILFVAHDLIMDGISPRILMTDFALAYKQASEGMPVPLMLPKTDTFNDWSQKLNVFAQTPELTADVEYWENLLTKNLTKLPRDHAPSGSSNFVAKDNYVISSLDREMTDLLLQHVPGFYKTSLKTVLLTTLVKIFNKWTGEDKLFFNFEGHGRELLFDTIDVTRTVGWFTNLFPIGLKLDPMDDDFSSIKSIESQLAKIPHHGMSYGLLRYLNKDLSIHNRLNTSSTIEVSFNYHDRVDAVFAPPLFVKLADEAGGPVHGRFGRRNHLLEIEGYVVDNSFRLYWIYNDEIHDQSTVTNLATDFSNTLKYFIEKSRQIK